MPSIFLTGGTGSFGNGFISYVMTDPDISMVRIYSRDEHKQRIMHKRFDSKKLSFYIGDVRDKNRLMDAMESCDWVIHAAALKQAPLGEIEPREFIKTNIFGTMNVIDAVYETGVKKAILVSTDKAVEPINLYGATKMCAERLFIEADHCRGSRQSRFACTRYGNVAGTSGSLIPILLELQDDEPTIVFDPQATRFWITLESANRFVLDSLKKMKGGEIFIPKLKSVRVMDIITAIRPESQAVIVGPRNGDKTHEVLKVDHKSGERYCSLDNEFMTIEEIRNHVFCTA